MGDAPCTKKGYLLSWQHFHSSVIQDRLVQLTSFLADCWISVPDCVVFSPDAERRWVGAECPY